MLITRRNLFRSTSIVAAACLADAYFYERHFPVAETNRLKLRGADPALKDYRIVQLSDLHLEPFTTAADIERAVALANSLKPDLVVITGDFVTNSFKPAERLGELLSGLNAPDGIYGCLGNHDWWNNPMAVQQAMEKHGVGILRNESTRIERNGAHFCLTGLESSWARATNLKRGLADRKSSDPVLLLMHEPDVFDVMAGSGQISAQLSGHTHNGQIRVPGFSPPVLPEHGKKYAHGSYDIGETTLYVNGGIGCIGLPLRFASPPEVTLHLVQPC